MRIQPIRTAIASAAAIAALLGGVTVPASAAQASATAAGNAHRAVQTYTFIPIRLTVWDIEDGWPDTTDEPHMVYGPGGDWKAIVRPGAYPGVIDPVDFTGSTITVDLWERDNGWTDNNHLGFQTVTVTPENLGQEMRLSFKSNGWNGYDYEFWYKVMEKN